MNWISSLSLSKTEPSFFFPQIQKLLLWVKLVLFSVIWSWNFELEVSLIFSFLSFCNSSILPLLIPKLLIFKLMGFGVSCVVILAWITCMFKKLFMKILSSPCCTSLGLFHEFFSIFCVMLLCLWNGITCVRILGIVNVKLKISKLLLWTGIEGMDIGLFPFFLFQSAEPSFHTFNFLVQLWCFEEKWGLFV